ncbi:hypothetical protein F4604DRAFT_1677359 [Suillus subluteus]|nr:hypothetical protein F4604DRAFT_1677359 [Suillus subluteus]
MASPNPNVSESKSASNGMGLSSSQHHASAASGSGAMPTTADTRAKHCIAALEDELEIMRQERGMKQRKTTYYVAQGRAIRRLVILYASLEDLISENDHRYKDQSGDTATPGQDCLQCGYIELSWALPWLHGKFGNLEHEDCEDMLKKLKKGADAARGDDTSCLKDLVTIWINQAFCPSPLIQPDDKRSHGFANNVCGKLLCPAEWDWDQNRVKDGICNRMSECIVLENSWPLFLYKNYNITHGNLEAGLFKSRLLVQAKVKTCVASIINMKKVTPRAIAYVVCQVRFVLSNISSWRTINGDFDYEGFWNNIVDFFENVPGPVMKLRVDNLLEWWTRNVFGMNHCEDLTLDVVSQMLVNTLAEQRKALEDAAFDSD